MSTKTTDTATGLTAPAAAGKTFDTVLADLAQPFDPEAVEFKAGATTQDKARARATGERDTTRSRLLDVGRGHPGRVGPRREEDACNFSAQDLA